MAFTSEISMAVAAVAKAHRLDYAALAAVVEVESAGKGLALVDGQMLPVIRWEGHYFDRRLSGDKQHSARVAGLASPLGGKIANPAAQTDRWALLRRAMKIDAAAALESCSWGLGQIMGAHWKSLGYASAEAMVDACGTIDGQVDCMARFINANGLRAVLEGHDWAAFARRYNGPGYRKNLYDTKLASAFQRHSKTKPPRVPAAAAPQPAVPAAPVVAEPAPKAPPFKAIAAALAALWVAVAAFVGGLPCQLTGWDYFCN